MPVRTLEEITAALTYTFSECYDIPPSGEQWLRSQIQAAIREAVAQRDMEWWEAVVLVDSVAPTPEAAKQWIAVSQDYHIKEAVAQERAALREWMRAQTDIGKQNFLAFDLLAWLDAREKAAE